jgi:ribA/ribD-fused uncharacterized protein
MDEIRGFKGEYRWLSNFWPVEVELNDMAFPTVENAYQAAKFSIGERKPFQKMTPLQAKKRGRLVELRSDWEDIKMDVMLGLLEQKFMCNSEMRDRLLDTGDALIVEDNTWGDRFWGVCDGEGENHLGRIIMSIRDRYVYKPEG